MIKNPYDLYQKLDEKYNDLNWWPMDHNFHKKNNSDPRFEIIIGAILTQNTAWSNVEKALINLKKERLLDIKQIAESDKQKISKLIKSSGYYNQKATRLKNISKYLLKEYNADLNKFFNRKILEIRKELLSLNGIGPETADSIILYAGSLPIFVVDTYTKRICDRLGFKTNLSYDEIQNFFQKILEEKYKEDDLIKLYNNFHAQIVIFSKDICKKKPDCKKCFIRSECKYYLNSS